MRLHLRQFLVLSFLTVLTVGLWLLSSQSDAGLYVDSAKQVAKPSPASTESKVSGDFDKSAHSLIEPASPWVIVNKKNSLPTSYVPTDLAVPDVQLRLPKSNQQMSFRKLAHTPLKNMFQAAQKDKVELVFGSGYRSASLQRQFYDSYVAKDGRTAADRYSARPGHSEHQTGFAIDITNSGGACHLEICFQNTPQGKWIAKNASAYGFIIRYLDQKESITGYSYEPWHLRYVGVELASELTSQGLTMEEFFGLKPVVSYD